jgi:phosphatidylinositol phospholipase C gamma-1
MAEEKSCYINLESNYLDPQSIDQKLMVRALYDYKANKEDELTFGKNAIISNVIKEEVGWWKGDYGGKKQHWFPMNYVEPIDINSTEEVCLLVFNY